MNSEGIYFEFFQRLEEIIGRLLFIMSWSSCWKKIYEIKVFIRIGLFDRVEM